MSVNLFALAKGMPTLRTQSIEEICKPIWHLTPDELLRKAGWPTQVLVCQAIAFFKKNYRLSSSNVDTSKLMNQLHKALLSIKRKVAK